MGTDPQLVIVALAAGVATVYAVRAVLRQFRRPDDEPGGCHGCPANRIERNRIRRRDDAR
jgi:hypothetical protein